MIFAIVLGAAVRPDGAPSPTLRLRVEHAAGLYHDGRVQVICTTGGRGRHGPPEAQVAARLLRERGVPLAAIRIEDRSTDTLGNIAEALMLRPEGAALLLVSSRWHLPPARLVAAALGVPAQASGPRGAAPWPATIRAASRELAATPPSLARAWRLRWARRSAP
ncbi:YdcF family protein [Jannaschia ovalis]|uniref:YdcF family protein n=1 Tax=Jannaschia ovalis TaxID=3038773 RepID=A0ABY8LHA6_9RHOB|nr:YdcF family protein [Jannaschia sp. GRR-S6-38]WGH80042.1 YdcF family protein [Jannaschia sp. GRR-S6-38]